MLNRGSFILNIYIYFLKINHHTHTVANSLIKVLFEKKTTKRLQVESEEEINKLQWTKFFECECIIAQPARVSLSKTRNLPAKFNHRQTNSITDKNTNNQKKIPLVSSVLTLQSENTVNLVGRDTSYNVQHCYTVDTGVTAALQWLRKIKGARNYEFQHPLGRLLFPASAWKIPWQRTAWVSVDVKEANRKWSSRPKKTASPPTVGNCL